MTLIEQFHKSDTFAKFLALSMAAHLAIVIVFTVKAFWFPSEPIQIRSAIRVDVVALPDKVMAPPPAPAPPKEPPKVAIEPPKPTPAATTPKAPTKNVADSQKKALDRLKALQAIDQLKREVEEQKAEPPNQPEYKGNILNKGTSLTGLEKIQYDEYFALIQQHVKDRWDLPQWLADANLKAQIVVMVDDRGFVIRRQIITSSGNEIFDSKVIAAIDQSSPFPPPPARLAGLLQAQGIVFNFP